MGIFYNFCIAVSAGIGMGFLGGSIKYLFHKKNYSEEQIESGKRLLERMAAVLKYITFLMLALGLVWCIYFLTLGVFVPEQADYANNMAELIVSVLTVISIIFAFVEFLRRK